MEKRFRDVKHSIVRSVALWICFFYILNPIQKPLYDILHNLTHNFSMPSFVAGHRDIPSTEAKIHFLHVHQVAAKVHDHSILNAIATIFEALDNNEDNKNDSQMSNFVMDKHFFVKEVPFVPLGLEIHWNAFSNFKMEFPLGYLYIFLRPPIPFFSLG